MAARSQRQLWLLNSHADVRKPASWYVLIVILFSGIIINHCMFRILFLIVSWTDFDIRVCFVATIYTYIDDIYVHIDNKNRVRCIDSAQTRVRHSWSFVWKINHDSRNLCFGGKKIKTIRKEKLSREPFRCLLSRTIEFSLWRVPNIQINARKCRDLRE